jgi:hypothetical protein
MIRIKSGFSVTVHDDQRSRGCAHAKENESFFFLGVFRIIEEVP